MEDGERGGERGPTNPQPPPLSSSFLQERVSFQPHPKTITAAGDYEYYAASGRSPIAFAVAELVDNSLRAARAASEKAAAAAAAAVAAGRAPPPPPPPPRVDVTIATNSTGSSGLLSVWDGGCGMGARALGAWAVMNLPAADRPADGDEEGEGGPADGLAASASPHGSPEVEPAASALAAARHLTGDLSFFGVGSKNAAFYLGRSVRVTTRSPNDGVVRELALDAAELEARYAAGGDVYSADLASRDAGDATAAAAALPPGAALEPAFAGLEASWLAAEGAAPHWTRVTVARLKPDVLAALAADKGCRQLARTLAHLYHYYVHGPAGRARGRGQEGGGLLPGAPPPPDIALTGVVAGRVVWSTRLADVVDDLESRYLKAAKAELRFALHVPGCGDVGGVLWYFPCGADDETVPEDDGDDDAAAAAGGAGIDMTQAPPLTQGGGARLTQAGSGALADAPPGPSSSMLRPAPGLECFWQGRLIPGARVDTLPFIDAVAARRGGGARDALPDDAFARVRGALFFGPGFRVTRNKLTFRDDLPRLLAAAAPAGRGSLERRFREWLATCHATLDKRAVYGDRCDAAGQAAARVACGEGVTAFARARVGAADHAAGDAVRLATKPALVGRILYFTVASPDASDGPHAGGRVVVAPLPAAVWGAATRDLPLRRLEGPASAADVADAESREMARVPASVRLEPLVLAAGLDLAAGAALPETAAVVLSGAGAPLTRCVLAGERASLTVVQRLWFLGDAAESGESGETEAVAPSAAARPKPSRKGGRKGGRAAEAEADEAANSSPPPTTTATTRVLVCETENRTPARDAFRFARIPADAIGRAGAYELEFSVAPAPPGAPAVAARVPVRVEAGPPVAVELRGPGRATAAATPLTLGAPLAGVELAFVDARGNAARAPGGFDPSSVQLAVHYVGDGDEAVGPPAVGLVVAADAAAAPCGAALSRVRVSGALGARSLALFAGATEAASPEAADSPSGAQAPDASPAVPPAAVACVLVATVPGLPAPALLPLRLRPGAPVEVELVGAHPWPRAAAGRGRGARALPPSFTSLALPSGAPLPTFTVRALDAWGTATWPDAGLAFDLTLACGSLAPSTSTFPFDTAGRARVDGLDAVAGAGADDPFVLTVACRPADPAAAAAVDAAGAPVPLSLPLAVEASRTPAILQLLLNGDPLPVSDDGDGPAARLEGVPAGDAVAGLAARALDAGGRPVADAATGKLQVSWMRGHKKVDVAAGDTTLPPLDAPDAVGDGAAFWVRLRIGGGGPTLEAGLVVACVAGPPAQWSLRLAGEGAVSVGVPFAVEADAVDARGNRCPKSAPGRADLPDPDIVAVLVDGSGDGRALVAEPSSWERAWAPAADDGGAAGGDTLAVHAVLAGPLARVALHCRDSAGARGGSRLTPDALEVVLGPGPPERLSVDPPTTIPVGLAPLLPRLVVRVVDACGNLVPVSGPDVALLPGALAGDGSGRAARVTAAGGNRAPLQDGIAVFTGVRVAADDGAGAYAVRAKPASRALAAEFGEAVLSLAAGNGVTTVALRLAALPAGALPAGGCLTAVVDAATEDGKPLPAAAAAAGLTLTVMGPDGERVAVGHATPFGEPGAFAVATAEPLAAAGAYSVAAEYVETRPELGGGDGDGAAASRALRSTATEVSVIAGPAAGLAPDPPPSTDTFTAAAVGDAGARTLLQSLALRLVDAHGNPVAAAGVAVALRLESGSGGGPAPALENEAVTSDAAGRAYFGAVVLAAPEHGVRQPPLSGPARLVAAMAPARRGVAVDGWSAPVVVTADGAGAGEVRQLAAARAEAAAARDALAARLEAATSAALSTKRDLKDATRAAAAARRAVGPGAPDSPRAARAAATASAAPAAPACPGRYGPPGKPATRAVDAALARPGVVGVLARLATVDDPSLAAVLAAQFRGLLAVVVVNDDGARRALTDAIAADGLPAPDVLALPHVQAYGGRPGPPPAWDGAGAVAVALASAACDGADPPLPLPLPHARALAARAAGGAPRPQPAGVPAATAWPDGCCGYAFNLVRPARKGHRAGLLFGLLGQTLVFESLDAATAYRTALATSLRAGCGDIVTLDGRRVTSKGIVSGASFAVVPADRAPWRFGAGGGGGGGGDAAAADPAALRALAAALAARADAADAANAAAAAADRAEARLRPRLEAAEADLAHADAALARGGGGGARDRCGDDARDNDAENASPARKRGRGKGKGAAAGGGKKRRAAA